LEKSFGGPELLSAAEGNGWRPEKGAEKVDAHKGSSLIAKGLPPILQCHLKRFNYDWQTDAMTKLNNRFCFPEVLDLSDLCGTKDEDDSSLTTYELQSVVIHMGEYGVGHYCELGLYGKPIR
jgi:ubiquitin carboxyl-terminal hydrolase 7